MAGGDALRPLARCDPLAAWLERQVEEALFLRALLDGPAPRVWVAKASGQIAGAVGLSGGGYLVLWFAAPAAAPWGALADALRGMPLLGVNGAPEQVAAALEGLGLAPTFDRTEVRHALALADLKVPDGPGALVPFGAADPVLLEDWRARFLVETLGIPPGLGARRTAAAQVAGLRASGRGRVLMADGRALGMTAFNAVTAGHVQVGGVWVPPEGRCRGAARRMVALHLAEARALGARRAVLFTANPAAARAYAAIGFEPAGHYRIVMFDPPARAGG